MGLTEKLEEIDRRYRARAAALEEAQARLDEIKLRHGLWTLLTITAGIGVVWCLPSVRTAIIVGLAIISIRWLGNYLISVRYIEPEMRRINREHPTD